MTIRVDTNSILSSGTSQTVSTDLGGQFPDCTIFSGTWTGSTSSIQNGHFIGFAKYVSAGVYKEACVARAQRYGTKDIASAIGSVSCIFLDPVDLGDTSPFTCRYARTTSADQFRLNYSNKDLSGCDFGHMSFAGVNCDIVKGVTPNSNGDVAYSGLGFEPACLIAIWNDDLVTTFPADGFIVIEGGSSCLGFGIYDGTTHKCLFTNSTMGGSGADGFKQQTAHLINTVDDVETQFAQAVVKSLDSDGFTLTWSNTHATLKTPWAILALGKVRAHIGNFTTANSGQTVGYTGVGFQPEALIFGSTVEAYSTAINQGSTGYMHSMVTDPRDADNQYMYNDWQITSGSNLASQYQNNQTHEAIYCKEDTIVKSRAYVNSLDADGFTLQYTQGTLDTDIFYLALKMDPEGTGWTNRGRYLFLKALHDGTALPTNYYLMLCTNDDIPQSTTNTMADLTEIANGNGYVTGGVAIDLDPADWTGAGEDDANDKGYISLSTVEWTATGGQLPTSGKGASYAVLTDDNGTTINERNVLYYWNLKQARLVSQNNKLQVNLKLNILEPA